ncbi:MAG: M16 family metallopeptidase [Myxococcaceae bacterium]
MKRTLLCALLLAGCATTSENKGNETPAAVSESEARMKPVASAKAEQPIGWEPLPDALKADPSKLKIPPLDFDVKKPEHLTLPNGLQLYIIADRAVPLINIRAQIVLGSFEESADKLGVADAMFDVMTSGGAGKLDADALDDLLEFKAAELSAGAGDEISSVDLNIRSEDLDELFPVFADVLLRPKFQKDRFDVSISRAIEGVKRRVDSPDGLAARAVRKAVYGPDSIFGREKTEKTLKAITIPDLQKFHHLISPKNTSLLITGDFDKDQMVKRVKELFGSWTGGEPPKRNYPAAQKLTRRVIFVPRDVAQAKVRIGTYGFKRLDPNEYAARVMATALGGGIGAGRMYKEVRDQMGLAYSAWASVQPGPTTGMFLAGCDTRPEQASKAVDASLKILDEARGKRPFDKSELALASDMYLNSFAFRFDEPDKIVREKAVYDVFGYPDDYLNHFRDNIAKVDVPAATKSAADIIQPDTLQIVVVGPAAKVGDLSKFGPVTTITDVEAFK